MRMVGDDAILTSQNILLFLPDLIIASHHSPYNKHDQRQEGDRDTFTPPDSPQKDPPKESVDENDVEQIEEEEAQAEEEEVLETESPMDTVEQEDAPIPTSAIDRVVLPGEVVGKWMENHPIRIGPGLSQINDRIVVTKAGVLRRPITKYFWVECHQKRVSLHVSHSSSSSPSSIHTITPHADRSPFSTFPLRMTWSSASSRNDTETTTK